MGNKNTKDSVTAQGELVTYERLICMGFDEEMSWKAVKKYRGNLNKCINHLTETIKKVDDRMDQQTDEKIIENSQPTDDKTQKTPQNNNQTLTYDGNINDLMALEESEASIVKRMFASHSDDEELDGASIVKRMFASHSDDEELEEDERLNKNKCWMTTLSYESIKDQGLVHDYFEWLSVKNTFSECDLHNVSGWDDACESYSQAILKYLRNRNETFRCSHLSEIFISGYIQTISSKLYIPSDIRNLILVFLHIIFIKFHIRDSYYELRTFDANFSFGNLIKVLECEYDENKAKTFHFIRIWMSFGALKFIYSVIKDVPLSYYDNKDQQRYVELPFNYYWLCINDIDKSLRYNEVLKLGIEIKSDVYSKPMFIPQHKQPICIQHSMHHLNFLHWICSLNVGDIIRVQSTIGMIAGFIVYRDYDSFYVCDTKTGTILRIESVGSDLNRLLPRYDHRYYVPLGMLHKCNWITDFKRSNVIGVLLEGL